MKWLSRKWKEFAETVKSLAAAYPLIARLGVELTPPCVLAAAWTALSWRASNGTMSLVDVAGKFGAAFAVTAYVLSQFFRIHRQVRTEQGQSRIEERTQKVLSDLWALEEHVATLQQQLDGKTEEIVGSINGGDTACIFIGHESSDADPVFGIAQTTNGRFPIEIVHSSVLDIEARSIARKNGQQYESVNLEVHSPFKNSSGIIGHTFYLVPWSAPTLGLNRRTFSFHTRTKSGYWVQVMQWRRTDKGWIHGTCVWNWDDLVVYEKADESFPRHPGGSLRFRD